MTVPEGGEAFDIPGVRLSHHQGHCTFHATLREYQLTDPVLQRIARIVDEADVVQEATVEAAAPGLDLICRGIRRTSRPITLNRFHIFSPQITSLANSA